MTSIYDRAAILPGRSMTRSKAPGRLFALDAGPLYCAGGDGAELIDTDGRRYLDMLAALGAISLGYGRCERRRAGVYSLPHLREVEAAEAVLQHVAPWASSVRFVKTGSEATHGAYRIAKKATGRREVYVGNWAYHGWHEWATESEAVFSHGQDPDTFNARYSESIAAVFIEPHRWEPVNVEWLKSVRAFCDRVGALLVFDSMIYGGRWALGGTSEYFGVTPDLECFGKAFGNGQSVAFIVGNDALAEHGELVSGTYSGDVTGLSAVCDVLSVYTTEPVIDTLWERGRQLARGLNAVLAEHPDIPVVREGAPVHQRLRFTEPVPADTAPYDYRLAATGTRPLAHGFAAQMAKRGILWHPDVANICYAHTEAQIERVIDAASESLKAIRQ